MSELEFKVGDVSKVQPYPVRYRGLPPGYTVPPRGSKIVGMRGRDMVAIAPDGFEWIRKTSDSFGSSDQFSWAPTGRASKGVCRRTGKFREVSSIESQRNYKMTSA